MTEVLIVCLVVLACAAIGTLAFMTIPITNGELTLWHTLHVQNMRRWITRTRKVNEPLDNVLTLTIARSHLRWHLLLTCLFCGIVARALALDSWWMRVLASGLAIPSIAYFLGSIVQRQKIAIITARSRLEPVSTHVLEA